MTDPQWTRAPYPLQFQIPAAQPVPYGYPQPIYRQPKPSPYPVPAAAPRPHPQRSVTYQRRDTSHLLHLVLTVMTGGAWGLLVWLPLTCWHKIGPRRRSVTRYR